MSTVLAKPRVQLLALALASLAPYLHTLGFGFIAYDDPAAIVQLPLIRSLSLARIFTPDVYAHLPEYMPLKNLSYALDYALFGLWAPGYRVQQQLWYALAVLLTFAWLRALFARAQERARLALPPAASSRLAFACALLFALHPVHVESVTWLSGRKDVLSGCAFAGALWSGLSYLDARSAGRRGFTSAAWCTFASVCALLSKPTAVVLPVLLLLQDVWLAPAADGGGTRPRPRWPLYLALGALCGAFALFYRQLTALHASGPAAFTGPRWLRIGEQLSWDLLLSVSPSELVPIYPSQAFDAHAASWAGAGAACCLAIVGGACILRRRHLAGFAAAFFAITLAPSLFAPAWDQYVAPRYLFHAVLGPIMLGAWALFTLAARMPRVTTTALSALAALWLTLTAAYASEWRDAAELWSYAASVHPDWPVFYDLGARDALGRGDVVRGRALLEACVAHTRASVCKAPLGGLLLAFDPARGERLLRESLPDDASGVAHLRLAQHLADSGRAPEALAFYEHWLSGRGASTEQITAITELALRARQPEKAENYLKQIVRAAALRHPASPPPAAEVESLVARIGEPALIDRVRRARAHCTRTDCFAAELGW